MMIRRQGSEPSPNMDPRDLLKDLKDSLTDPFKGTLIYIELTPGKNYM